MRGWLIVIALAGCRDKPAAAPPAPEKPPPVVAPASKPVPTPALPALEAGVDLRGLPAPEAFAAEHEDRAWKQGMEGVLRDRLAKLPGGVPQIECRQTLCLLTLGGAEQDVARAIDQLQQLQDISQQMMLTREGDTIRAYLRFER